MQIKKAISGRTENKHKLIYFHNSITMNRFKWVFPVNIFVYTKQKQQKSGLLFSASKPIQINILLKNIKTFTFQTCFSE